MHGAICLRYDALAFSVVITEIYKVPNIIDNLIARIVKGEVFDSSENINLWLGGGK